MTSCSRRYYISLLTTILTTSICSTAIAAPTMRDTLFEDCAKAKAVWQAHTDIEKADAVTYLADVVKLNTQVPDFPGAFYVAPGGPRLSDPAPGALWQAVDAKRELDAKLCALEILASAGPVALPVLPALVQTYTTENLGDEVAVSLEEAAFQVVETSHLAGATFQPSLVDSILTHIPSQRPLLASNIVREIPDIAIPRLVLGIAFAPEERVTSLLALLLELDPNGEKIFAALPTIRTGLTPDQLLRLALIVPVSPSAISDPLLAQFAALAVDEDPAIAKPFAVLIGRLCSAKRDLSTVKESLAALAQRALLPVMSYGFTTVADQACLLEAIPPLASSVLPLLDATEDSSIVQALMLLPQALTSVVGKPRNALFQKLKDILQSRPQLSLPTLSALTLFKEKGNETVNLLIALLKKPPQGISADLVVAHVLTALEKISNEKWGSKFNPFIVDALQKGIERECAVRLLAASGQAIKAHLQSALTSKDFAFASGLLHALALQKSPRVDDVAAALTALREPELVTTASTALIAANKRARPLIVDALAKSEPTIKRRLLSILVRTQQSSQAETEEFARLHVQGSCEEMQETIDGTMSLLAKITASPEAPGTHDILTRLIECLPVFSKGLAKLILEHPSLYNRRTLKDLETVFLNPKSSIGLLSEVQSLLTDKAVQLTDESGILSRVLQSAPREPLLVLLRTIAELGASPSIEQSLSSLVGSSSDDPELQLAAKWALARVTTTPFDPTALVRERIDRWGNNDDHLPTTGEIAVLKHLPLEGVLSQIQVGLRSGYIPIAVGAARVAAALGSDAIPVASRLRELLSENDPPVRYAAALALLTIDPTGDRPAEALRRVLVNRYYPPKHRREFYSVHASSAPSINMAQLGTLRLERLRLLLGSKMPVPPTAVPPPPPDPKLQSPLS